MQVGQRDCFVTLQVMSARLPSPQNFLKLGDEKSGCLQKQLCVEIMFAASVLNKKQRGREIYSSIYVLHILCVYVCMCMLYVCKYLCVCAYICIIVIIDFITFIVIFIITVVSRLGHSTSEGDG
jgi:hypothetical protein